jgi:hypothetical protein
MSFFDVLSRRKNMTPEMEKAFEYLDRLHDEYPNMAYTAVKAYITKFIIKNADEFTNVIRKGFNVKEWVYGAIGNTAAEFLNKRRCYTSKGLLSDLGKDTYEIYVSAMDELLAMKAINENRHKMQIDAMQKIIEAHEKNNKDKKKWKKK